MMMQGMLGLILISCHILPFIKTQFTLPEVLPPPCDEDVVLPDDLIVCGSCENRCGSVTNPDDLVTPQPGALCSCDQYCGYHDDCCADFEEFCPKEFTNFQEESQQYPSLYSHEDFSCRTFRTSDVWTINHTVIDTCLDGSACVFVSTLSEDVNTFVPMYDVHRGIHYISAQCALCNNAFQVIPWDVQLTCRPISIAHGEEAPDYISTGMINSTESLRNVSTSSTCSIFYQIYGQQRRCNKDIVTTCNRSCANEELVSLCETANQAITSDQDGIFYRNVYCALCNAEFPVFLPSLACGIQGFLPGIKPTGEKPTSDSFSLTLVFDFDPRRGLTVGKHNIPDCKAGEIYVPDENACRSITCPSGFVLDGSDCIPEATNITATVNITFTTPPTVEMMNTVEQDKETLDRQLTKTVVKTWDMFDITQHTLNVWTDLTYNSAVLSNEIFIQCNCDYSSLFTNDTNMTSISDLESALESKLTEGVAMYLVSKGLSVDTVRAKTDIRSVTSNVSGINSEENQCTWLVYQSNETSLENETVRILNTGKTYTQDQYKVLDDLILVCETDFSSDDDDTLDLVLSIITLICIGISIICLIIRVVLQFLLASFKKRPGKLQFKLTVALLLAFVMVVLGPFLSGVDGACVVAAVLLAYGFLAAFTWMNVIAMDTWLVFRPSAAFSRADDEDKSLIIHTVLGWGIPLVLVVISIIMNYADIDENFQPNFGGDRCWYTERYAMLVYFGVPIGFSILLNTFLYIHTSINLRKAFNNATKMMKAEGYQIGIYIRLFILMGITWIFGFISAFTDDVVIDIIFVILTSLQGLFLFISFVCNKRTLSEIRNTVTSETSSTSNKRTKSTPLPSSDLSHQSDTKV